MRSEVLKIVLIYTAIQNFDKVYSAVNHHQKLWYYQYNQNLKRLKNRYNSNPRIFLDPNFSISFLKPKLTILQ